jgi:hypothetical protein
VCGDVQSEVLRSNTQLLKKNKKSKHGRKFSCPAVFRTFFNGADKVDHVAGVFRRNPGRTIIFNGVNQIRNTTALEEFFFRPLLGIFLKPAPDFPFRFINVNFQGLPGIV